MENLVSKSVTFAGLLAIMDNNGEQLFDFVMNLKNEVFFSSSLDKQ